MNAAPMPRFLYLDAGEPPFFAAFHPAGGPHAQRAALLCPPFGWEDMCSYRSRREWAQELSRAGIPALRFDLPGSGDSAGAPVDPAQLRSWTHATAAAACWLREETGVERIVAVGIGLGGMVACLAAFGAAPIEELVLWHVPARGRALVRELRAFSALEVAYIPDPNRPEASDAPELLEPGALVANGYRMSAETVAELERLDLGELPPAAVEPRRALLLGRDGIRTDERLRARLERGGASVTLADGPGYGAMTVEPQEATPPVEVFAIVDAWLRQQEPARTTDVARASTITTHEELQLSYADVELRERPMTIDGPDGPLFGILAERRDTHAELCAVLVNAGAQRHTGPNRMWVEIARRWAARGVPTLRFDLAGIGESDGDASALAHVAAIYSPAYGPQMRAALDAFGARGLPERFLVLGLCAGSYWSLHTALEDDRVRMVVMLNPRSLIWDEGIYGVRRLRELRERVLLPSTWGKALRGELNLARHMETARALALRASRVPRRLHQRRGTGKEAAVDRTTALAGIFDSLRDRDQRALLLFTGSEPLHRELAARGLLAQAARWPNLEIAIRGTSADTHTLTPLWLQRQVHELVDGALEGELARTPQVAAP